MAKAVAKKKENNIQANANNNFLTHEKFEKGFTPFSVGLNVYMIYYII